MTLRNDSESAPLRGLRVSAPSNLSRKIIPLPIGRVFTSSTSAGATHGALMHALFEQVRWLEDFQFDRDRLRQIAATSVDPEALRHASVERILDEFAGLLGQANVRGALSRQRYSHSFFGQQPDSVEIDNERMVSLVLDRKLVSGTIDRLAVLHRDGRPYAAEIFDFKTDQFETRRSKKWLQERVDHHRPQLEIYAQVVAALFGLPRDRIATYLVMLASDDLVCCDPQ